MMKLSGTWKIILIVCLCLNFSGCYSKYYKQNDPDKVVLRSNPNDVQTIELINKTDTLVYYQYPENVSGTRPLFGRNNEFFQIFRYNELSSQQQILLQIKKSETLKIRYKKAKQEVVETIPIYENKRFIISDEGIATSKR